MRRFFWFMSGVVAGISAFIWAKHKVVEAAEKLTPASIGKRAMATVRQLPERGANAVRAGRAAFQERQQQVRADRQR